MEPSHEDMEWPAQFREAERNYAQFYVSRIESLAIFCLYVGRNNNLESVHQGRVTLEQPGKMTGEELKQVAARCSQLGGVSYRLSKGGVFCLGIGPDDIIPFISTDWEPDAWTSLDIACATDISLPDAVHTLGEQSSLILLFRARAHESRKTARRTPGLRRMRVTRRSHGRKGLKAVRTQMNT